MRGSWLVVLGLFLTANSAHAVPPAATAYEIRAQGGFYVGYHNAVSIRRLGGVWIAERRYRTTEGPVGATRSVEHGWIDGRRCPALETVVASIRQLPRPSPGATNPTPHGFRVSVTTVRASGVQARTTDFEGPVAGW